MNHVFFEAFIDELEKQGFDPLSIGIGAVGGHLLTNLGIQQAMKSPTIMPDVIRTGFEHGQQRLKMSPVREAFVTKAIGPEVPWQYHMARQGGRLARVGAKAKTPEQKARLARLVAKVVFPTPPFSLETVMTYGRAMWNPFRNDLEI